MGSSFKKLLTELEGTNKETGEITTIINELRNTSNNFMQVVASNNYTFSESIELENAGYKLQGEITYENWLKILLHLRQ